jgi:glutathione S-transferase
MLAEVAVQSSKNVIKILRHRNEYKKSRDEFLQLMDEWKGRLGDKPFHGGEEPDEADFAVILILILNIRFFLRNKKKKYT